MHCRSRITSIAFGLLIVGLPTGLAFIRYWPAHAPVPLAPSFKLLWTYEAAEPGAVVSSPLIDGDRVFVGVVRDAGFSSRGAVVCLNRNTGKPIWTFDDGGEMLHMFSSPRLSDGRLYIGEGMHANFACKLYCLDAGTGKKLWYAPAAGHIESTPCVADGAVFFGAGDAGLIAVDAVTGKQQWQFAGTWHIDSSPAVSGDHVFVGSGVSRRFKDSTLFCLDAKDMHIIWREPVNLPAWGSPVVDGGQVVFGLGNGRLGQADEHPAGAIVCRDAATGRECWRHDTPDSVFARPYIDETSVYFTCRDGTVSALDRSNGQPLWSRSLGSPVVTTPARLGNRLYVTTTAGSLHVLNAGTGDILATFDVAARFHTRARVFSSPAVVAEPGTGRHLIAFAAELLSATGSVAAVYAVRY